jgi:hypothetical protein
MRFVILSAVLLANTLCTALLGVASNPPKQIIIRQDWFYGGPYSITGQPYLIRGQISSIGNEVFQSIYLHYQVNDEDVQSTFLDEIGLNPYFPYHYQAETHWVPQNTGEFMLKVWFTGLNDAPVEQGFSDTLKKNVTIYEYLPARQLALLESFSSINCGSCATVAPILKQMVEKDQEKYAMIYYHPLAYEGSPLFLFNPKDQTSRKDLFDITYTPVSAIGTTFFGSSFEVSPEHFDLEREKFAAYELSGTYSIKDNLLEANLNLQAYATFAESAQNTLLVVVVEDHVHFDTPPGSNGEKDFYYVMRSFLPDANGTLVGMVEPETSRQFTLKYNMSELNIDQESINVLAFVQDLESLEFHQAIRLSYQPQDPTGINLLSARSIKVFPNPSNGHFEASLPGKNHAATIKVFDLGGRAVFQQTVLPGASSVSLDLSHFHAGIYLLQIVSDNQLHHQKISIVR